VKSEAIDRN